MRNLEAKNGDHDYHLDRDNYLSLIELRNLPTNHVTYLCVCNIKHTPDHFRAISYMKHEYFGGIPSLFRDVTQLRW
jgi:hypothetical protein